MVNAYEYILEVPNKFIIPYNGIGNEGAKRIAEMIRTNRSLKNIILYVKCYMRPSRHLS